MLASLVQTLSTAFGNILEWALNAFMEALNISNLSSYLDVFPLLSTFYTYLRSFSVAMTAIIAGKALATFAMGSIDNGSARDNPGMVLVKTFFAVGGIYWGGYVLDYIVHLGSIPYDQFLNVNAVGLGSTRINLVEALLEGLAGLAGAWAPGLALGLLELFVLAIIAWNIFKLVLEVCERWLMVGILVYTSPLVYCTIPSNDTSQIFKRWASMFVGSVMQMSLSVMFLKLILSGFNGKSETPFILKMLMILAMCKIAQRLDTYLQQLGVGVATTGGNLLDDIIAGVHALRSATRGGGRAGADGGSRQSILGSAFSHSNFGAGLSAARRAWNNNASVRESIKAGAKAASDNMKNKSFAGRAVKELGKLNAREKATAAASGAAGQASGKANSGNAASPGRKPGASSATQQGRNTQAQNGAKATAAGTTKPAGSPTAEKPASSTSKSDAQKTQMRATAGKTDAAQAGKDAKADHNDAAAKATAEEKANQADTPLATAASSDAVNNTEEPVEAGKQTDATADDIKDGQQPAEVKDAQHSDEVKDQKTSAGDPQSEAAAQETVQSAEAATGKSEAASGAAEYSGRAVHGQADTADTAQASEKDSSATDDKPAKTQESTDGQNTQSGASSSADLGSRAEAGTQPSSVSATASGSQEISGDGYSGRATSSQPDTNNGVDKEADAADAKTAGQDKANEVTTAPSVHNEGGSENYETGGQSSGGENYESGADDAGPTPNGDSYARIDTPPKERFDPSDPTQEPKNKFQAIRRAFYGSHQYAFSRGEAGFSAADYKNAEQAAAANHDAVADRNNEFATGHEAMPESVRDKAEQILNRNSGVRSPSGADAQLSYRTSGVTNASGNVLESIPEGDLRLTHEAVAAGAEIGEVKNADGTTSKVLQDRSVAGMVAGAYMASAIDQNAVTSSGERTYSAVEGKSAFVKQRMESDSHYEKEGRKQADKQRREDRATMASYERSMPETKSARRAAGAAHREVEALRNSGAAPEIVQQAEAAYQNASDNLYYAAVAGGSRKMEEARQRMASYDRQGMSHDTPEYQAAEKSYQEHSNNLNQYREAHDRASTPGSYDRYAAKAASELRESEAASHAATYDAVQKNAAEILNNTIQNASPIALSKALLDPNYHPADCAETRAIADRLFGDFLQDRKAGSQLQSVVVSDHFSNTTISGQELDGGRSIAVTYQKKDGTTATATFVDAVGSTSLPDGLREKMKVCKTGDGREWLSEGIGANMSARPTGTQIRRSNTVSKVFAMLRKLTK